MDLVEIVSLGERLGYEGQDLQEFVKAEQKLEREERLAQREERQQEIKRAHEIEMAPLPLVAGPSTMDPFVLIGAQLRAQDTPSVNQGARPAISTKQTMQSTQRYGTLPYITGPLIQHPCRLRHPCHTLRIRHPCRLRHPCCMLPCLLCQQGLLYQWVIMVRAISSPLCLTIIG